MSQPGPGTPAGLHRTEVVTHGNGRVAVRGELTPQGADLVRGAVETLQRQGRDPVVLDLADVTAVDDGGRAVLQALRCHVAASGGRLLVRNGSGTSAAD